MRTLREAFLWGKEKLKKYSVESPAIEPAIEARILLSYVLGISYEQMITHDDKLLGKEEFARYDELLGLRCKGMPVQYITGQQEFMSLNFHVTPDVLIPRHDTEILVETAIELGNVLSSKKGTAVTILDIGTGSGCIAVSLAYYLENCMATAIDISEKAIEVARANAEANKVSEKIEFLKSDLFSALKDRTFDIIVSNPPYIKSSDINTLQPEVALYEPKTALDGGKDGLDYYTCLAKQAKNYLKQDGMLVLELGIGQAGDVAKLLQENFVDIQIKKDLSSIERVIVAKKE